MTVISIAAVADFDEVLTGDALVRAVFGKDLEGDDLRKARRRFYRLAGETAPEHRLPVFRLGVRRIVARRSTLAAWLAAREQAALAALGIEVVEVSTQGRARSGA